MGKVSYHLLMVDTVKTYEFAVWKKDNKGWSCVDSSPFLAWMLKLDAKRAGERIKDTGFRYSWIKEVEPIPQSP